MLVSGGFSTSVRRLTGRKHVWLPGVGGGPRHHARHGAAGRRQRRRAAGERPHRVVHVVVLRHAHLPRRRRRRALQVAVRRQRAVRGQRRVHAR